MRFGPPEKVLLTRSVGLSGAQSPASRGAFCYGLLPEDLLDRQFASLTPPKMVTHHDGLRDCLRLTKNMTPIILTCHENNANTQRAQPRAHR